MNWEVIIWTCVTVGVLVGIFGIILTAISAVNMKKRREQMAEMHQRHYDLLFANLK